MQIFTQPGISRLLVYEEAKVKYAELGSTAPVDVGVCMLET